MHRTSICAILALILLAACAPTVETVNLVDGADRIKIFRKVDPPAVCTEIRPFSVKSGSGCGAFGDIGSYEASYNAFRNAVLGMGGNAALIDNEVPPHGEPGCYVNQYLLNGVAYRCPDGAVAGK